MLRGYTERFADSPAVTYLADGEVEQSRLNYAALDAQARSIAATLQDRGLTGKCVLLAYPPGTEYISAFWGCLYAGVVAVPIFPPRATVRASSGGRIRLVVEDTRAQLTLTTRAVMESFKAEGVASSEEVFGTPLLATDGDALEHGERWRMPALARDSLAFLQYTSGSTSAPKGVMVSHGNILANEELIASALGLHDDHLTSVGWLPIYHDMGLIGIVLAPLCRAGHVVLMSPVSFLQRPVRFLQAITKYRAYFAGAPNFGYSLCARKVTEQQKATLDLSCWGSAFNGAERVRADTLEAFAAAFASCGFRREALLPCYGLAEATLIASGGPPHHGPTVKSFVRTELGRGVAVEAAAGQADALPLVSCGEALIDVRIVDPETQQELPPGRVGEIWIHGPHVAGGYWGRAEVTREVFHATIAGGTGERYLRTGDLGFVERTEQLGVQLYVTGRIKDLIIVDGRNLYPEDVERCVEQAHPEVRPGCCAAFSVVSDAAEDLVIVIEVEASAVAQAVAAGSDRSAVLRALVKQITATVSAEHEARVREVVVVKIGSIPKTSSGKLQRSACRAAFVANTLSLSDTNNA
ncbi:MAG TPA: fatty acyl-AMP ligase [Kofleriaceae bacterium]|nr:fatty acyl-AMP ligase [Kofleriaceae bacterium]